MKISKHLYALAIAGAVSSSAYAQTTLYSVGTGAPALYYDSTIKYAALGFTTTATAYTITAFEFNGYQDSGNATGNISFSIYSNNSGAPGSVVGSSLGTFSSSNLGTGSGSAGSFGLTGLNVTLTPSATYWLVADFSGIVWNGDRINLNFGNSGTPTPTYGGQESQSGSAWQLSGFYTGSVTAASVSPVPEASGSVAGLGLAMAGLYQLRRRKAVGRAVES